MAHDIKLVGQRLTMARLLLDMLRDLATSYAESDEYGSSADELVLMIAVAVGHFEGKPMSSSKLAKYAGVPRATTIRKLNGMVARGLLVRGDDGGYTMPAERLNEPAVVAMIQRCSKRVKAAAAALSKMDA